MKMLNSQVILVTGAGQGLGREIAIMAAKEGASVVVNDIGASLDGKGNDRTAAEKVVGEIEELGGIAVANFDSVSDWNSAHAMVSQAVDRFGRLDGIVNNAGILRDSIFHKMQEQDFDAVVSTHLKGTFNVSRAAAEQFRAQDYGRMVHMTSTSGLIGSVGQANYSAAKMGIIGLSTSIAIEMGRYNVTSNCVAPFAFSRMTGSIPVNTKDDEARMERIKTMEASKVAVLVAALLSKDAAKVSGQVFSSRANEISLYNAMRPFRTLHRSPGWRVPEVVNTVFPAFESDFSPLEVTGDVYRWDPV
ncbi:SDR family NAD(P)-dependent oxidoreductase [Hoeflea poritis]|uniref:SDR family NAD(P)-dependent oxidoreductase n=1 Tax=Hoeflea poritis TaxID=2993659 RepID=A0ABT4VV17_9HYPH|nr:SDR family NAD(P)-dependent oxidoreductase [Hoeflea poritis]MDA4848545.1 SDR family NAD(P)-dependent oxidoreductase [Hoeflea poritis]